MYYFATLLLYRLSFAFIHTTLPATTVAIPRILPSTRTKMLVGPSRTLDDLEATAFLADMYYGLVLKDATSKILPTITSRIIQEEALNTNYKRSELELAVTLPAHARAPPDAPSPLKRRHTYSRDAFRRRTKPKYRKRT